MSFRILLKLSPLAIAGLSLLPLSPAKADPPPTSLPVFCFRFTDIKQVDAASNTFKFEFEVLNWTREYAKSLTVKFPSHASNSTWNTGIDILSVSIDSDGRFLPPGPAVPPPGNQPTLNGWLAGLTSDDNSNDPSKTANYLQSNLIPNSNPIPNIDLVGITAANLTQQQAINAINSLTSAGHFPNHDFDPINNPETIDNGTNVLDGFVFETSSFDPGDHLVLSWSLGPDFTSPAGNGIAVLARDSRVNVNFSPSVGGLAATGFSSSNPRLFAPNSLEQGAPLVGSEYGFSGIIGANVPASSITSVDAFPVPGPLPVLSLPAILGSLRRLSHVSSRLKQYNPET